MSAKLGCYSVNLDDCPYSHQEIEVPLKSFSYDIELSDSLAFLELQQTYVNTLKKTLDVQYIFPINPSAAIYHLEISFGGRKTRGIVKSKAEAEAEFKEHQEEGREAGYVSYNGSEAKDVMKVRLGNIYPGQQIKVNISYIHTVSVVLNSFYEFRLNTTITPRYLSKLEPSKIVFSEHFDKSVEGVCSWFLRIRLKSSRKIKACFSKTHAINSNLKVLGKDSWEVLIEQKGMTPNKDFVLNYCFEDMDKPSVLLGESDNQTQAVVSFVPKFCSLSAESAQKYAIQSKEMPLAMSKVKAEYIFFLDRSGSMGGQRIAKAKQALVVFLKSLPTNTFFNVVSFGSDYELMYPQSQKYTQEIITEAIQKIDVMDSNMGGTEILYPLRVYLQKPPIEDYPRQIFLLTDGAVSDTANIKAFVRGHTKFSRVHGIGIGNGASEDLILGCAQQGKGYSVMISDTEDPTDKIIDILDKSLSPAISKIQLSFEKERVQSVVPNPQKNPYILKNQVANFYLTFNGKLTSPLPVTISYTDSFGLNYSEEVVINPHSASWCSYLTKVVGHHSLSALYAVYKYGQSQEDHLYYVKQINKQELQDAIIRQSIQKQLLCQLTAFICVNDSMPDAVSKERMRQQKQSIKINPMNPVDHLKVVFGSDNLYWQDSSDDCIIDECAFVEYPEECLRNKERQAQHKKESISLPKKQYLSLKCIDLKSNSNRETSGVLNHAIKKVTALQIIKCQNANGMWVDDEVLSKLYNPKDLDLIKNNFSKYGKQIWSTLAFIQQIKTYFMETEAKKFMLILRKAQQFIDRQSSVGFLELERAWNQKVRPVPASP